MAGIGLSPGCVPCDEGCIHQTFVGMCHNLLSYSFISTSIYNSVHHICEYNQLQNCSNHFDTPCINTLHKGDDDDDDDDGNNNNNNNNNFNHTCGISTI